jgi:hypothetical protein
MAVLAVIQTALARTRAMAEEEEVVEVLLMC